MLDASLLPCGIKGIPNHEAVMLRRTLLITLAAAPFAPAFFPSAWAQDADPRLADRAMGPADAKVVVTEWFSMTCSHCADFQKNTFPTVKAKLIDTGRIRYVWRDFPLDKIALAAAMVARALPAERYEPFISTLLATQDRWAFARNVNPMEELAKLAALAGLPRRVFDETLNDTKLQSAILALQDDADKNLKVSSTPTFVMNGHLTPGAVKYEEFERAVNDAA